MDEVPGDKQTTPNLIRRILAINFTVIHTLMRVGLFIFPNPLVVSYQNIMQSFIHVLYYLAEYPEHTQTLCEVQEIINHEGWTYAAITKMVKGNSFIKKTQCLNSDRCGISFHALEPDIRQSAQPP